MFLFDTFFERKSHYFLRLYLFCYNGRIKYKWILLKRSTAALLIAIMFHLIIAMGFWILAMVAPKIDKKVAQKEHRMKVSLKQNPKAKKDAVVKNKQKPKRVDKPLPKGEQLQKITKKKPIPYKPKHQPKTNTKPPQKPKPKPIKPSKPKVSSIPSKKPYVKIEDKNNTVVKKPQEKKSKLYDFLSKETKIEQTPQEKRQAVKRESRIASDVKKLYGSEWGDLSAGEQKYLIDNQEVMRRLTQQQLNATGRTDIPNNFRVNDKNIIEFYLHPNGDITDIKFIKKSQFYLLDDVTRDTIEAVYWKYPRPAQKTKIRYQVGYFLRGY